MSEENSSRIVKLCNDLFHLIHKFGAVEKWVVVDSSGFYLMTYRKKPNVSNSLGKIYWTPDIYDANIMSRRNADTIARINGGTVRKIVHVRALYDKPVNILKDAD